MTTWTQINNDAVWPLLAVPANVTRLGPGATAKYSPQAADAGVVQADVTKYGPSRNAPYAKGAADAGVVGPDVTPRGPNY